MSNITRQVVGVLRVLRAHKSLQYTAGISVIVAIVLLRSDGFRFLSSASRATATPEPVSLLTLTPTFPPEPSPTPSATSTITPSATPTPTLSPTMAPTVTITPIVAPSETPTIQTMQPEWVFIPGGEFTMGSSESEIQQAMAECDATEGRITGSPCQREWFNEPQKTVKVAGFQITRYEITNAQYNSCVSAGVCQKAGRAISDNNIPYKPGYFASNYPVMAVNWYDASAFCRWIDGRLPTEAEWERAARGNDGRRYPWGNMFDPSKANLYSSYPSPVGAFPKGASPYGVMDMAGNVFEWTATEVNGKYVVRGGGWTKYPFRGRVTDRGTQLEPSFANYDIGLRCVR